MTAISTLQNQSQYIVIEGIDGAGKTEQAHRLAAELRRRYPCRTVHVVREPGSTDFGEAIRATLAEHRRHADPIAKLLLYVAARRQLTTERLLPLLEHADNIVIADRFTPSSVAYQTTEIRRHPAYQNTPYCEIAALVARICELGVPDLPPPALNILMHYGPDEINRLVARKDDLQPDDREYLAAVSEEYLTQARRNPEAWDVIQCGQLTRDAVNATILHLVTRRLETTPAAAASAGLDSHRDRYYCPECQTVHRTNAHH